MRVQVLLLVLRSDGSHSIRRCPSSMLTSVHRDHKVYLRRGAKNGHFDFNTAPEVCGFLSYFSFTVLYVQRNHTAYQGWGARDGHLDFHTAPVLWHPLMLPQGNKNISLTLSGRSFFFYRFPLVETLLNNGRLANQMHRVVSFGCFAKTSQNKTCGVAFGEERPWRSGKRYFVKQLRAILKTPASCRPSLFRLTNANFPGDTETDTSTNAFSGTRCG